MPQHTSPSGSSHAMPLCSYTADERLADRRVLVLDETGREQRDRAALGRGLREATGDRGARNHLEKRTLAKFGSSRSLAMPVVFSISVRTKPDIVRSVHDRRERRGDLALEVGAREQLRVRAPPCPRVSSIASDRSIRRGKSMTHSCSCAGRVRADDVTELALVALVDDLGVLRRR